MKRFKRRWMVLDEDTISYYVSEEAWKKGKAPKGEIRLTSDAKLQKQADEGSKKATKFQIQTVTRVYLLIIDEESPNPSKELMDWLTTIRNNLNVVRQRARLEEERRSWDVFGSAANGAAGVNPTAGGNPLRK